MKANSPTTSTGRPRLYADPAQRVDAFRTRQKEAGYLRREVLMTQETVQQLEGLAKAHGVAMLDVSSALLEHGLANYQTQPPLVEPSPSAQAFVGSALATSASAAVPLKARAGVLRSQSLSTVASDAATPATHTPENPITAFFQKRRGVNP